MLSLAAAAPEAAEAAAATAAQQPGGTPTPKRARVAADDGLDGTRGPLEPSAAHGGGGDRSGARRAAAPQPQQGDADVVGG
jgi:hypothetical protein